MGRQMGGLVRFPRGGGRRGDGEWHEPESAVSSTRTTSDTSLIPLIDVKRRRDSDDDGDGGGGRAA